VRRTVVFSVIASSVVSAAVTALLFILAMPGLVEAQVATIRGSQVIAVGDNGAERVRLMPGAGNTGQVQIVDDNGTIRIANILGVGTSGQEDVGITMRSSSGVPIVRLGTVGQPRGGVPDALVHSGNLILRDDSGGDRIRLLVADDGTTTIELINAAGEVVWSAP
jgi:hypothetical protein